MFFYYYTVMLLLNVCLDCINIYFDQGEISKLHFLPCCGSNKSNLNYFRFRYRQFLGAVEDFFPAE